MHAFRRILVPVQNLRQRRDAVLERAAQIALGCGARVELFHDLATPIYAHTLPGPSGSLDELIRASRSAALERLERLAAPLRVRGLEVSTAALWDYPRYEAVIRRALAIRADLIIAPKRGHHRMPALLGYTDWELLRASPVPLLLIKGSRGRGRAAVLAATDPLHAAARGATLEREILRNAAALAAALRAPLHTLHVQPPWARPEENLRAALERQRRAAGIRPARVHLLEGEPDALLPATAHRLRAGTVVMGAISRRGLKRLFLGNTAERVLDDLRCDVLVIKPPGFRISIPRKPRGVFLLSSAPLP